MNYPNKPYSREGQLVPALICSLEDPAGQQRCQIQTGAMSDIVDRKTLPWAKVLNNNSQVHSEKGGTMTSSHTFKVGDWVMVNPPLAEGSHNYFVHGHPGTIANNSGGMGGTG